ncbi:Eukaryotic translation initiation factor 5 [Hypsibius exemplaris]|uniref:Eukaryotic translation initiation factor 5 n=1 Tax=Hypsibius exemplaris TaxID=2072580 RepID=A0A1W0WST9_HYPEX|nr:Eukaryotic translation initiation factor 5 [Hypsibius exemplaris]
MAVNVDRSNNDPFYRYKMPRLVAKVEGSGNGIKTVVANITDIAKSLERPPTYPLKYFGYELGAQTMIDAKNERYIVNGSHDALRLQELLDGFIKKFVLCPNCNNPETVLQVKKTLIRQNCAACGHNCIVDMKQKLTSYILKNPPAEVGEYGEKGGKTKGKGKKGKAGKEDEEKKENGGAKNGAAKTNGGGSGATPNSPTTETEDPGFDVPPPVDRDENGWDDDDWGEEDSVEARKERQKDLTNGIKHLTLDDDLEKTEDERLDIFYEFVKKHKEGKQIDDKEIMVEAERLEIREKAPLILANVLFDEDMVKQIGLYRKVFLRFTHGNHRAQKLLLGGFEHLVGVQHSAVLMPKAVAILKEMYDKDVLEEEVLLDWYDKPSKKYTKKLSIAEDIRKKVFPFIKWLREAEPESSEEEDDGAGDDDEDAEEDIPVVSINRNGNGDVKNGKGGAVNGKSAPAGKLTNGAAKAAVANINGGNGSGSGSSTPPTEEDDAEDVDIDAI